MLARTTNLRIGFSMQTADGISLCGSNDEDISTRQTVEPGVYTRQCRFPGHLLNAGTFFIGFSADVPAREQTYVQTEPCLYFHVIDQSGHGPHKERLPGIIRPGLHWKGEAA